MEKAERAQTAQPREVLGEFHGTEERVQENRARLFPLVCAKMKWAQTATRKVSPEQNEIFFSMRA